MTFIFSPEHWTMRGGPSHTLDTPYTYSAQGQVQRDRSFFIYNASGAFPLAESLEMIEKLRALARTYAWTEILWERRRRNGLIHIARIPISCSANIANSQ